MNMTPERRAFAKAVRKLCMENYDRGGDVVVECFTLEEIAAEFETFDDVKDFCGLLIEKALDARWGEDNDPEVTAAERFKGWKV